MLEAAVVFGCAAPVMQSNLLEFQGQGVAERQQSFDLTIFSLSLEFRNWIIIYSGSSLIPVHKHGDKLVLRLNFSSSPLIVAVSDERRTPLPHT